MNPKHCNGLNQPLWVHEFIRDNIGKLSAKELSAKTGLSVEFMYSYCRYMDYSIRVEPGTRQMPHERNITSFTKKKEPLVRPKAVYDNKSREERIAELLAEGTNNY